MKVPMDELSELGMLLARDSSTTDHHALGIEQALAKHASPPFPLPRTR
jgi:hypothetical protein